MNIVDDNTNWRAQIKNFLSNPLLVKSKNFTKQLRLFAIVVVLVLCITVVVDDHRMIIVGHKAEHLIRVVIVVLDDVVQIILVLLGGDEIFQLFAQKATFPKQKVLVESRPIHVGARFWVRLVNLKLLGIERYSKTTMILAQL